MIQGTFTIEVKEKIDKCCVEEIFSEIDKRMILALMFHCKMADYFEFLGLQGLKRLHEYQYFDESKGRRKLHRYYIDHVGKLISERGLKERKEQEKEYLCVIPPEWFSYTTLDVGGSTKSKYTCNAMEKYLEWEEETKCLYECCVCALEDKGEIALANFVSKYVDDVQDEIKKICRLIQCMSAVEYDTQYILLIQDKLHEKYKECMKHLFE